MLVRRAVLVVVCISRRWLQILHSNSRPPPSHKSPAARDFQFNWIWFVFSMFFLFLEPSVWTCCHTLDRQPASHHFWENNFFFKNRKKILWKISKAWGLRPQAKKECKCWKKWKKSKLFGKIFVGDEKTKKHEIHNFSFSALNLFSVIFAEVLCTASRWIPKSECDFDLIRIF